MELCNCGSTKSYEDCCGPLISGERSAETAEALLRSRYTAYARREIEYIKNTIHPEEKEKRDETAIRKWAEATEWTRLEILNVTDGGPEDKEGQIEFVSYYREKEKDKVHSELATFVKEEDTWYYKDSVAPKVKQYFRPGPKIGRNQPCPCGSGKKYKKCCG